MSVDGTWNITLNSPMGAQQGTLELKSEGSTLTGTMSGPQGALALEEGTVDGNNATWKVNITQPMAITIEASATVDGDNITGEAKLGAFGSASFTGTRA